ncbi:hypothetical protein [Streptomyces sp. NBC_00687]|uniref:hypothetical protein n=1 Tax=Streptomyces sp. NBC_00687 TaxID=2975807 RepID=UPI002259EA2A|nr:hypothetical protein [Streptomyces sp. NBC_00687]MCX4919917.1 hypothetical protein [Streptomyces sp. NBC_00687]
MDTKHRSIDGYVDALPEPGSHWGTATFDLIHSPADIDGTAPDTPDTIYACTTHDPALTRALLSDIHTGDLLRVTGTLTPPNNPDQPARFTVTGLEVIESTPLAAAYELVLERWGHYVSVFDADCDEVAVFTVDGTWVGEAANPDTIQDLIDAHEDGDSRR